MSLILLCTAKPLCHRLECPFRCILDTDTNMGTAILHQKHPERVRNITCQPDVRVLINSYRYNGRCCSCDQLGIENICNLHRNRDRMGKFRLRSEPVNCGKLREVHLRRRLECEIL